MMFFFFFFLMKEANPSIHVSDILKFNYQTKSLSSLGLKAGSFDFISNLQTTTPHRLDYIKDYICSLLAVFQVTAMSRYALYELLCKLN